jgi:hypothetical protein
VGVASQRTAGKIVSAIAAGRIAIGAGTLLATRPALRALGFPGTDPSGRALARLAGGRDLALGVLALVARNHTPVLRAVTLASVTVDASDALILGLAARRHGELRLAGIGGVVSGGTAAVAGTWAWRQLGK